MHPCYPNLHHLWGKNDQFANSRKTAEVKKLLFDMCQLLSYNWFGSHDIFAQSPIVPLCPDYVIKDKTVF